MEIPKLEVETPGGAVAHADHDSNDEAHRRRQRLREKEGRLLPHSTVTVAKGHLLIASHRDILERVLSAEDGPASLAAAPDYAAVQAELGKFVGAATSARGFGREDETVLPTYELLRQGNMPQSKSLLGQMLNDMLGDGKPGTVREQKIDGSTLPEFDVVRRYFGTNGLAMETRSQGWYIVGLALPRSPQQEQEVARSPAEPAANR
jgi:plasmid stability protein